MIRPLGLALALVITGSASPAHAGTSTNVKCATNEDRVWVYENLDDFNLAAKLKCGDPVQVESRVKGYVKIQTADGTEGYVLDAALPKSALPPAPEEKPNTVEAASLAFAARRASRSAAPTVSAAPAASPAPAAIATSSAPAAVSTSAAPAPATTTPAPVQPAVAMAPPAPTPAPTAPTPAPVAPASAPVYASQPVSAPAAAPVMTSTPTVAHASSVEVETVSAPAQPAPPAPTVAAKYSNPQPIAPARAKKHKTSEASSVEPAVSTSQPMVVAQTAPPQPAPPAPPARIAAPAAQVSVSSAARSQSAPMVASRVEPSESTPMPENSASLQPVSSPADQPAPARVKPPVNPDDDDDTAVRQLEEDTSNCAHYFSAYGLSPNQYKWLAQNRHKAFPSVCPAPTPAMVDFVVIFTHDVAFYSVTMPDAVHVEQNGFSDWTPLSTVDTALMTRSEADKSHHEYVWVFHTTRGAFDPSKFSSHRRPLFSKSETNTLGSRGGFRTVMDALTFIEQNGTNR
ncbi:MAG: SH3 domain-containing protein [Candidatus Acidiferrales bacterium]